MTHSAVESKVGQGTVFHFYANTGAVEENNLISQWSAVSPLPGNRPTIEAPTLHGVVLVAEDSPDIQRLVSMYVQRTGAEVILAENGEVAIELALATNVDLILMDMQMPVMDGLEAITWLRKTGYDKPIIALTANAMAEDRERYRLAGANGFLAKPIIQVDFYAILERYLAKAEAVSERSSGHDNEYQQLVERFVAGLPTMLEDMTQAIQRGDPETIRSLAHKLKGMGGSFGYPNVSTIAAELESSAMNNQMGDMPLFLGELAEVVRTLTTKARQ